MRGNRKDIGLGGLSTTTLADAREEAASLRGRARKGEDTLMKRRMEKRKANVPTFEEAAKIVHKEVAPTLKNDHNKVVWLRSLDNHVFPTFGKKTVDAVESTAVLRAIAPYPGRAHSDRNSALQDADRIESDMVAVNSSLDQPCP